eukprot:1784064-Prymnesium_polylepis.1
MAGSHSGCAGDGARHQARHEGGPANAWDCDDGYATDDVFYLEVCSTWMMCNNGDELFELDVGEFW